MDLGLNGKIALVTGAASGVGREIALNLAAEGAILAVNFRSSSEDVEALAGEIVAKGGRAKAYRADVADFAAVKAMVETIVKDLGGLNILINNAGLALRKRFVETTTEDWRAARSTPPSTAPFIAATQSRPILTPPATAAS
jgi:NAD(P)-dependent dehydrogenase (short-subunit alcohol dehydrogenase family)